MNSLLPKTAALLCAVLMAGSLAACGSKSETKEKSEASAATSAVQQSATPSAGTAEAQRSDLVAETVKADTSDNSLEGSWEYESGSFTYTFNSDGSGVYDVAGTQMKFTYTAENSVLAITYEGSDAPMELEYELNGDILNVKDSAGNDTIYHRK